MSDTPRTDAKEWALNRWSVVQSDFARELERELAALVAERDTLREQRDEARRDLCRLMAEDARRGDSDGSCDPKVIAAENGWDCFEKGGGA